MKKVETIIFDLDGTLLNTLDDITNAVNYALNECGLAERSGKEVSKYLGDGYMLLMDRAVGDRKECLDKAYSLFMEYYSNHLEDCTLPYEGVVEGLKALYEKGKKMAIVSNKGHDAVQILCSKFFAPYITVYIGVTDKLPKKPAPDMLYVALEKLNADKQTTIMVGDSEPDIEMANSAGIDIVSVQWGYRDRDFLIANGAKTLLVSTMQLANL